MARNHHDAQKGGTTLIWSDAPSAFQRPSLFVPFTRKV